MAEILAKEIVLTTLAQADIKTVFEYGAVTFGFITVKAFVAEVYISIWSLDYQYNMYLECRFLLTKSKMYRNVI
jgi:hypothetical protein